MQGTLPCHLAICPHLRRTAAVCSFQQGAAPKQHANVAAHSAPAEPSGTWLPEDEDANIIRDTFMKSYEEAQPCQVRIPGMQDFAAAVWNRYRNIPSSRMAGSTLDTLFNEFDADRDGHLTAAEIASALNSRGVLITEQEAAMFIRASDANSNETVERTEWPGFIWSMAAADLSPNNLDPNLPRCVSEPQVALELEPGTATDHLQGSGDSEFLHSWFRLRTQPPDQPEASQKVPVPDSIPETDST